MTFVFRGRRSAAPLAVAILISSVPIHLPAAPRGGSPPTVQFDLAPAPGATVGNPVEFAWHGDDADGTVSVFRYAIDPPEFGDPYWIETGSTMRTFFFQAATLDLPVPASGPVTFSQPHTVVLKAVDDEGLESDPVSRAFFASTIAPEVQITSPTPSATTDVLIGRDVTITWQGTDSDGFFTDRPVKYKRLLIGPGTDYPGGVTAAWNNPAAFRDYYAPSFAGWDSTSGDTAWVKFGNLNLSQRYLFCVVGFDESGAYSARFGRGINMIRLLASVTPTKPETWGRLKRRYR